MSTSQILVLTRFTCIWFQNISGITTNDRGKKRNTTTEFTDKNQNTNLSPMARKTVEIHHRTSVLIDVAGTSFALSHWISASIKNNSLLLRTRTMTNKICSVKMEISIQRQMPFRENSILIYRVRPDQIMKFHTTLWVKKNLLIKRVHIRK